MAITTLGLRVKRVINLKNYNSLSIEAWAEAEVEDFGGEDPLQTCREHLREELMKGLDQLADEHQNK